MQSKDKSLGDLVRASVTVFGGLLVLGLFVVALGGFRFWESYTPYHIVFESVKNLGVGQPVKLDGMPIGRVRDIQPYSPDPSKIQVTIGVQEDITLYANSQASISQTGLVGDQFILINLEGDTGPALPANATLNSKALPSLMEVGEVIAELVTALKPRLERIAEGLEMIFTPENTKHIANVLEEMEAVMAEAKVTLALFQEDLEGVGSEAKTTLRQGAATLRQGEQTLSSVEQDFAALSVDLRAQVNDVGTKLASLSSQVQTDLGYNQEQLTLLLDQLQRLSEELTVLTQDVKERPWDILRAPRAFPESTK